MAGRFNKLFVNKLYMPDGKLKGQNDKMARVTISASEANALDGATAVNDTTGKAAILSTDGSLVLNGALVSNYEAGTAGAGTVSASEAGYGARHTTKFTLTAFNIGAIAAAANEAIGALLYTFPATGDIIIHHSGVAMGITGAVGVAADTPDVGLGTVVGTGAVATLDGTPTFENIMTGQTWSTGTMDGTQQIAHVTPTAGADLVLTKGAANKVFLNIADGWAAASASALVTGYIWLDWSIRTY
jgi:hypothetical protein